MAKIAFITDTHAGVRGDSPAFHNYLEKSYKWFFDIIDNRKIKHVIHLGDIFDRRKYVNYSSLANIRKSFFDPLNGRNIQSHFISGNHDQYFRNVSDVNALDELISRRYNNITTYLNATTINIDDLDILIVPWINEQNYKETLNVIKTTPAEIAVGHLEIAGFQMYKGLVNDSGLDSSIFNRFDAVYSGHYHHRSSHNNINYIGAFAEYTWADYNDERGISIFDTETRKIEFIQNPNKIFKAIVYDDIKEKNILEKIEKTDFTKYKEKYIKVIIANKSNLYAFDLFLDNLYKECPHDISLVENISSFKDETVDNEKIDMSDNTLSIIDSYISGLTLQLPNDKVKQYVFNLYNEALKLEVVE